MFFMDNRKNVITNNSVKRVLLYESVIVKIALGPLRQPNADRQPNAGRQLMMM